MKRLTPRTIVLGGAILMALVAMILSRRSTFAVDGNLYFEMARQMSSRGSIGLYNGLDVVDSVELSMINTVRVGLEQFPMPAPLYALAAAPAYALGGLRGLTALNALSLVFLVYGFFLVARRLLDERAAMVAALAMPPCTLVFSYSLWELPHVLAAACLIWALYFVERACDEEQPRAAFLHAAAAGLLIGFATGVRLQLVLAAIVLAASAAITARQRRSALLGFATPFTAWLTVMAAFNQRRFGSINPFSYGITTGSASSAYFVSHPGVLHLGAVALLMVVALYRWPADMPHRLLRAGAALLALMMLATSSSLRTMLAGVAISTRALFIDPSTGWMTPRAPLGWMMKSLLQSSPFLVLGVGGAFAFALPVVFGRRDRPRTLIVTAFICVTMIAFLTIRLPDNGNVEWIVGGLVISPRYLLEITPLMFLIACYVVREVTLEPRALAIGLVAGVAAVWFLWTNGPYDLAAPKRLVMLYAPLLLAAALAIAWLVYRRRGSALVLGWLIVTANSYGAAITIAEEGRAIVSIKSGNQRWLDGLSRALPERFVLVGYDGAMDAAYPLRATHDVVIVNSAWDEGASILPTLRAFSVRKLPIYYVGVGLERIVPRLWGTYLAVPLDATLFLWRLDPVAPAGH